MKTIGQLDEFEGDVVASAADILLEMEYQQQSGRLNAQQLFDAARTGMAKDRAGEVRLNDEVSTGGTAFLTVDPDLSEYFVVTCFNGEHIQLTFNKPAAFGAVVTVAIKFDKTYVDTAPGTLTLLMQDGEVYKLTGSTLDLSAGAVPDVLFATIWGDHALAYIERWESANVVLDGWQHMLNLPAGQERELARMVAVGDGLIIFPGWGEQDGDGVNKLDIYKITDVATKVASGELGEGEGGSYFSINDQLFVFGGLSNGVVTNDLFMYSDSPLPNWQPVYSLETPLPRAGAASFVYQDKLYLLGGDDGEQALSDLSVWDYWSSTWFSLSLTSAIDVIPKFNKDCAMWVLDDYLHVVGAAYHETAPYNRLEYWTFDLTSGEANKVAFSSVQALNGTSFTYIGDGKVAAFGGFIDDVMLDSFSVFDAVTLTRNIVSIGGGPGARAYHCQAIYDGYFWVVGGGNEIVYLGDVWRIPVQRLLSL